MNFVRVEQTDGIATVALSRGKVNALNTLVVDQLAEVLQALEVDQEVRAIILTGRGKFFSFGFDIPEFLPFTKEEFSVYLTNFTHLYRYLFLYRKPVVAALNGHTIAGGCMLALACDHRLMVTGKAKISLNEIGFGSTIFAGSTEMLRFWVGGKNATAVLYSGAMYSAEEAKAIGLVDEVSTEETLMAQARKLASDLGSKYEPAFSSMKSVLRVSIVEEMTRREETSIREFLDIWYSEPTRANLRAIKIY